MGAKNAYRSPQRTTNGTALMVLEVYHSHGDALVDQIVTGDKTWVKRVNCETKLQSMKWGTQVPLKKQGKCQRLSTVMVSA
ncbi:hypothetical protein J6590_052178 [Homalodisca vitripennis]|nr:hypothetical protein J6590_052178 [Homalodisca vitripennis]